MPEGRVYGRNPVLELLRAHGRRADEIAVLAGGRGPLAEVVALARRLAQRRAHGIHLADAAAGAVHRDGEGAAVGEASREGADRRRVVHRRAEAHEQRR